VYSSISIFRLLPIKVAALTDLPRESIPSRSRGFGLHGPVVAGKLRQLLRSTDSSEWLRRIESTLADVRDADARFGGVDCRVTLPLQAFAHRVFGAADSLRCRWAAHCPHTRGYFCMLRESAPEIGTRWRSGVNSDSRYRIVNAQTTAVLRCEDVCSAHVLPTAGKIWCARRTDRSTRFRQRDCAGHRFESWDWG
jgi:hypothetical protein